MNQILESAQKYREQGLQVIPLQPNSKKPLITWKDYQQKPLTDNDIEHYFNDNKNNIGVMCGQISNNLLVIDFDSKTAFNEYRRDMEHILNDTLSIKTKRGYHVYVKSPEPLYRGQFEKVQKVDMKYNGYVVAPFSEVDNYQYNFFHNDLTNIYTLESLEELPFKISKSQKPDIQYPETKIINPYEKPYGLSKNLFNVLKADPEARFKYASRSEAEQGLITHCVLNNWNFEQIRTLFLMHAVEDTHYREKENENIKAALSYLRISYYNAIEYLKANKRKVDQQLENLHTWLNKYNWPGRTSDTDRALLHAILQIAKRSGKLSNIGASTRELAELTGMHRNTIHKALNRNPFLIKSDKDEYYTNTWSIDMGKIQKTHLCDTPSQVGAHVKECHINAFFDVNHDLFRRYGLGKNGVRLYTYLLNIGQWCTAKDISKNINMAVDTVRRKLERMIIAEIVEWDGSIYNALYRVIPNVSLDSAAEILGTAGSLEKQKADHKKERLTYKIYRENKTKKNNLN